MTSYPRVAILGDSLATGRDASNVINSFGRLVVSGLQARSAQNAIDYLLHGVGGIATGELLDNLQAFGLLPTADLVIVEVSTNDVGHSVPLAQFETDSAALATYLLGGATKPLALVWLTPWYDATYVNTTGATAAQYRDALTQTLAPQLRAQYPSVNVATVDLGALCVQAGTHLSGLCVDTFHPNDYGHQLIAQAILADI